MTKFRSDCQDCQAEKSDVKCLISRHTVDMGKF